MGNFKTIRFVKYRNIELEIESTNGYILLNNYTSYSPIPIF